MPLTGRQVRVLAPEGLAVSETMLNRPRNRVDIDEMGWCGTLDRVATSPALARLIGSGDPRFERLANPSG